MPNSTGKTLNVAKNATAGKTKTRPHQRRSSLVPPRTRAALLAHRLGAGTFPRQDGVNLLVQLRQHLGDRLAALDHAVTPADERVGHLAVANHPRRELGLLELVQEHLAVGVDGLGG